MAKLTTSDLATPLVGNSHTTINNNFTAVETAMEKTLSRDGTSPNSMEANLDMNSNRILNLPAPLNNSEPARKADLLTTVLSEAGSVKNVVSYGALGDGSTDDTSAIQSAINAGEITYFPAGTYIVSQITLPSNHYMFGDGAVIKLKNNTNGSLILINNANLVRVGKGITLNGNSANNSTTGIGVRVQGSSSYCEIECDATDFDTAGVSFTGTGIHNRFSGRVYSNITDGFVSNCEYTQVIGGEAYLNGRFGYLFGTNGDYSRVVGAAARSNVNSGFCAVGDSGDLFEIQFVGCVSRSNTGHGFQFNNVTRGVYSGCIAYGNGISGFDFTLVSPYGTVSGCISQANVVRGLEIDSGSDYVNVSASHFIENGAAGISIYRSRGASVIGCSALGNGTNAGASDRSGIHIWDDLGTQTSNNCRIIGNDISDDGGAPTQQYGIFVDPSTTSGLIITNNKFTGNVVSDSNVTYTQAVAIAGNQGWEVAPATLTLAASWVAYDAAWQEPVYWKDEDGWVHVHGVIKDGTTTAATVIGTLPAGYRPAKVVGPFSGYGEATGIASFYVSTGGAITANSALDATRTAFQFKFKAA